MATLRVKKGDPARAGGGIWDVKLWEDAIHAENTRRLQIEIFCLEIHIVLLLPGL
jgi:hypothetical protein